MAVLLLLQSYSDSFKNCHYFVAPSLLHRRPIVAPSSPHRRPDGALSSPHCRPNVASSSPDRPPFIGPLLDHYPQSSHRCLIVASSSPHCRPILAPLASVFPTCLLGIWRQESEAQEKTIEDYLRKKILIAFQDWVCVSWVFAICGWGRGGQVKYVHENFVQKEHGVFFCGACPTSFHFDDVKLLR